MLSFYYNSVMTYLICSDLHGDEKAFDKLLELKYKFNADAIISAGDFCPTLRMEAEAYNTDFRTVMGNCDRYHTYTLLNTPRDFLSFEHRGRKVIVTHGDHYHSPLFELKDGDIFISGHTHVGLIEKENGIILFNPGSPSRPRDGEKSFGLLTDESLSLLSFPSSRRIKELAL